MNILFEMNIYILSFSWLKGFVQSMIKTYSWVLLYPTILVNICSCSNFSKRYRVTTSKTL